MSSVTPLGFPNATELILRAGAVPHYLFASQLGGQSASPVEGTSISAGESTVTSVKTENWATNSADCHILDNQGFQLAQTEGSHLSVDRLALLASVASEPTFRSGSSTLRAAIAPNMSAYLSGPNSQSEALQTLHLMNPNFSGYGDSLNSANMVMFNPGSVAVGGGQESPLHNAEQQQHLSRFARSSAVNQTSYSHPSQMAAMSNVELGHQVASTDFYNKRPSNQGYSWGGGNEFSFLPSGHVTESNQEIGSHSNLVKSGQLSTPEFSHFGVGNLNSASYSQQAPLSSNSVATVHDMNMENLRQPSSAGQILSLSLSSQQPSVMQQLHSFSLQHHEPTANFFHGLSNTGSDNLSKENLFHSKCAASTAGGSFTIPTCGNVLGAAYSQMNPSDGRHMGLLTANFSAGSYGSKYLRPAQELLNEVVNVGQGLKGNPLKRSRSQSWMTGHSIGNDGSFMKSMSVSEPQNKSIISWGGGKEDEPIGSMPVSVSTAGNTESNVEPSVELSSADRQELQAKRAKLVGMRDEVDRRYKQYYHQMQAVATSFESVAGLGAAAAYTALALQTISKHFRCLRDAITGQIQATCKALGEEEVSGMTKGETSRLRFIDQQLRQQRALRQLGMMQQQAWRPQRGLPEHSVSILRAWLFEHFLHPYPKDADKIMLAKQTGLNRNQVSNWFINARVRLWKPMVEEMYLEETKEADTERANRSAGDNDEKGRNGDKQVTNIDATINESSKPFKQIKLSEESSQAANYSSDLLQGRIVTGSQADHLLLQEKDCIQQGSIKERPGSHDVSTLLGVDYKANKSDIKCGIEAENKVNRSDDSFKDAAYPVAAQNGSVQADQLNLAAYGSYQMNGMGRYSQENFGGTSYAANGDVFLTLGLQRCEGMPYSGGQQHYGAQNSSSHLLW